MALPLVWTRSRDERMTNSFRFGFIADCQLGCAAGFSGMTTRQRAELERTEGLKVQPLAPIAGFDWDLAQLERAIAYLNDLDVEFVVVGGDMIDDATDEAQYAAMRQAFARLRSPVMWVAGNHDVADDGVTPTPDSLQRYRDRHGDDLVAFDHGGATFLSIDTVVLDQADSLPDEVRHQVAWLDDQLARAAQSPGPLIVFGHHPLFVDHPDEPDSYWNLPSDIRRQLIERFSAAGVSAYFCGHLHRNESPVGVDFEMVASAAVGFPLGNDPSGLRIVEVSNEALRHRYVTLDDLDKGVRP